MVADFAEETVARLDDARLLRRTQQALGSLTRTEAEVVGLCVWSGLSYAEASEALGSRSATVRSRLNRARTRLRALTVDEQLDPHRTDRRGPPDAVWPQRATEGQR